MKNIFINLFKIQEKDLLDTKISQAPGKYVCLDAFFKFGIDKFTIIKKKDEKITNKKDKKIIIDRGGILANSNMDTIRYLFEGMVLFNILNFDEVKKTKKLTSLFNDYINTGKYFKNDVFLKYNSLWEYIDDNYESIIDNISKNVNNPWNKTFFKQKILGIYWYKTLNSTSKNKYAGYQYLYEILVLRKKCNINNSPKFIKNILSTELVVTPEEKRQIKNTLSMSDQQWERHKKVIKLRRIFRENLIMDVIEKYGSKINENTLLSNFPILEGAHIVSVKRLIETDRIEKISDANNGILIDPNLHSLFDSNNVNLTFESNGEELSFKNKDETVGKIKIDNISSEKIEWLKEAKVM